MILRCGSSGYNRTRIMVRSFFGHIDWRECDVTQPPQLAVDGLAPTDTHALCESPASGALAAVNARPQTAAQTGRMSDDEYRAGMDLVAAAVRILLIAPVDQMRAALEHAETLAPILEPTAYQRGGGDNLYDQRQILDAAAGLVAVAERVKARASGVRR